MAKEKYKKPILVKYLSIKQVTSAVPDVHSGRKVSEGINATLHVDDCNTGKYYAQNYPDSLGECLYG